MKQAFTLLEFVITLVIFAFIGTFISKAFTQFYHLSFEALETNDIILETNFSLLRLEKLLTPCINLEIQNNTLSCLLKDEDFVKLENSNSILINSTLVLEQNGSFYSPKSDFLAQLENKKALFGSNTLYALIDNAITQIPFENSQKLFKPFKHFTPLLARLNITLENKQLLYELKPQIFSDSFKQTGILADNVSLLELTGHRLKICLKKEDKQQCLEKRLHL